MVCKISFTNEKAKIALWCASMVVTYYIKLFRTRADRHSGILMSLLLLLVAETISWLLYTKLQNNTISCLALFTRTFKTKQYSCFCKSPKVTINILLENVCQGMKLFSMINRRGGGGVLWSWVVGIKRSWVEKIRKINLRGRRKRRLLGAQEYLPTCWWESVFWRWCIAMVFKM